MDHDNSQRGQGLVEYAFILVLVAVVVIVILALAGPALTGQNNRQIPMPSDVCPGTTPQITEIVLNKDLFGSVTRNVLVDYVDLKGDSVHQTWFQK